MRRKKLLLIGVIVLAGAGATAFALASSSRHSEAQAAADSRTAPQLVRVAVASEVAGIERAFTGTVAARVQSNLGFRVSGKIVERLIDVGQQVIAGQPLMRVDDTDLGLALIAKRNEVAAARAVLVQATAEEKRFGLLVQQGSKGSIVSVQRYEQAKAGLDTAEAQLAAAQAEADVAENATTYTTLIAEADGMIMATVAEPGQVVAAGQTVIQFAQGGAREAVVNLPEAVHPALGSTASASVYGEGRSRSKAHLRQISDAADPQSRTYEARYVLEGDAASAPLGSTVTLWVTDATRQAEVDVPVGAILDDGSQTGVWAVDRTSSTVRFVPVKIKNIGAETASVIGIERGQEIVALGAHLLKDGVAIRIEGTAEAMN